MSCIYKINRPDGSVEIFNTEREVLDFINSTQVEQVSQTFEELVNNPVIGSNAALSIYKETLSEKFKEKFTNVEVYNTEVGSINEPKIFYTNRNGFISSNYAEVLKNTTDHTIQIVASNEAVIEGGIVVDKSNLIQLGEINTNTDNWSARGVLNGLMRVGIMAGKMIQTLGGQAFSPNGATLSQKKINLELMYETLSKRYGRTNVKKDSDTMSIKVDESALEERIGSKLRLSNSREVDTTIEELLEQGKSFKELNEQYENFVDVYANYLLGRRGEISGIKSDLSKSEQKDLAKSMIGILSQLGISTISMDNYKKNYKKRHGVDVTVEALADMTEKVIAFGQGELTLKNMTEEVAHVILESFYDQDIINELEVEVENTSEWKTWSAHYYQKYSDMYSGSKLDKAVRREVLGKILASKMLNKKAQNSSFYSKVIDLINRFFEQVGLRFQPQIQTQVGEVLDMIASKAVKDELSGLVDQGILNQSDLVLYSSQESIEGRKIVSSLLRAKEVQKSRIRTLSGSKHWATATAKSDLSKLTRTLGNAVDNLSVSQTMLGMQEVLTAVSHQVSMYQRYLSLRGKGGYELSLSDQQDLVYLVNDMRELVDTLGASVVEYASNTKPEGDGVKQSDLKEYQDRKEIASKMEKSFKELSTQIGEIKTKEGDIQQQLAKELMNKYRDAMLLTPDEEKMVEEHLTGKIKEENWLQHWAGNLEMSSNRYLALLGKLINDMYMDAEMAYKESLVEFLSNEHIKNMSIKDFKNLLETGKDGKVSSKLISAFKLTEFQEAYDKVYWQTYLQHHKIDEDKLPFSKFTEEKDKYRNPRGENPVFDRLYDRNMELFARENQNRYFTKEYYELMDKRLDMLNITPEAYESHKRISSEIRSLRAKIAKYKDVGEVPESLKMNLADAYQRRQELKLSSDTEVGEGLDSLDWFNRMIYSDPSVLGNLLTKSQESGSKALSNIVNYIIDNKLQGYQALQPVMSKIKYESSIDSKFRIELSDKQVGVIESQLKDFRRSYNTTDDFIEQLTEQGNNAFDWLMSNGSLVLNDNFFSSMQNGNKSVLIRLLDSIKGDGLEVEDFESRYAESIEHDRDLIEDTIELMDRRAKLLKVFQTKSGMFEVDFQSMETRSDIKHEIFDLENKIKTNTRQLGYALRLAREVWEIQDTESTETDMTDSYKKSVEDFNGTELEFLKKHTTEQGTSNILKFDSELRLVQAGAARKNTLEKVIAFLGEGTYYDGEGYLDVQAVQNKITELGKEKVLTTFARTQTYSFFRKTYPEGFLDKVGEFKNDGSKIVEFLNKSEDTKSELEKMFEIRASFDFMELSEEDMYKNEEYLEDFQGGFAQPNAKYLNNEYFSRYGLDKNNLKHRVELNVSLANNEEYQARKSLLNARKKINDLYEMEGTSIYEIPQVSENDIEKAERLGKGRLADTIKNSWKNFSQVREDDLDDGALLGDTAIQEIGGRTVPKYYTNRLKNQNEISHDFIYSYGNMLHQAHLYSARVNSMDNIAALKQGMASERFSNGKIGTDTLDYKKMQEFIDAYIYGIKRNKTYKYEIFGKEYDFGKMIQNFDGFLRVAKVGASPIIALTGMSVSAIQSLVEQSVGEYIGSGSYSWGRTEFAKLAPNDISETGNLIKTSKLRALGEKYGSLDIHNRISGSAGYGRFMRSMNNLPFKFMEMADFPISQPMMLGVLDDYRYYDEVGKFVNYKKFRAMQAKGASKGEIKTRWKELRKDSAYNHLVVKDGKVAWSEELKEKLLGEFGGNSENVDKYLDMLDKQMRAKTEVTIQNLTMNMRTNDRSMMDRNPLLRPMLAFRGWLQITASRKFKRQQYNFMTGSVEEGHYMTLMRHAGKYLTAIKSGQFKQLVEIYNQTKDGATDLERRNMRRVLIEISVGAALLTLGMMVAAYVDDEDNEDNTFLQFLGLLTFRTVNEYIGTNSPGMLTNVGDIGQSPYMMLNTIRDVIDYRNWSPVNEVGKQSAYAGHSKLYKLIISNTLLGQYYKHNPNRFHDQGKSYRFYNSETLPGMLQNENPFYDNGEDNIYED